MAHILIDCQISCRGIIVIYPFVTFFMIAGNSNL